MPGYIEPLTCKVTKIKDKWHCRLYCKGRVEDELVCQFKEDIRLCFKEMLRWYDKMGNSPYSKMADASRERRKNWENPKGKVWRKGGRYELVSYKIFRP